MATGSTGPHDASAAQRSMEVVPPELADLRWDNRFLRDLPIDPSTENRPRQVHRAVASRVRPVRAAAPALVAWSPEMSAELGLDPSLWTAHGDVMAAVLAGNLVVDDMDPHAACYGGHQFGHWAGQLGDGRAISLGELVGPDGRRHTLQLKGAGPTPYSRSADGMAVLRSSIREFLCSEAMHHLGIPTTRALGLVVTGDKVVRDMFYDGNPRPEPGAVLCRVAPSFLRFGNFQIFAARQELDELRQLADFTVSTYFGRLLDDHGPGSPESYTAFFDEVCASTLAMVVGWMRVGFVHGVMNTDNMSIHGATIDYGPYGWLEDFDPGWTPNTTDAAHRRYRYGQQPQVAHWNLLQLANALVPLTGDPEPFQDSLQRYGTDLERADRAMWRAKLGLGPSSPDEVDGDRQGEDEQADALLGELFGLLTATETDMTIFFRRLADVACVSGHDAADRPADDELVATLADAYYLDGGAVEVRERTVVWLRRYGQVLAARGIDDSSRRLLMNQVNPKFVLRNYLAQIAIDAAEQNDFAPVNELLDVMRRPYDDQPAYEQYAAKRPEWARSRPGCSQLSCSS